MKRAVSLCVVALVLMALASPPVVAAPAPKLSFALSGDARALELGIGNQGVTLGAAIARADSTPSAQGLGAGECGLLGDNPDPTKVACQSGTVEKSSYPGDAGKPGETCAAPSLPAPLDTVLQLDTACGSSESGLSTGGFPTTSNEGKVAEVAVNLDLSGLSQQLQDAKSQVIDALQQVISQAPDPIKTALEQILNVIDVGQAGQLKIGVASSNIATSATGLTVASSAAGAQIGVLGIPEVDAAGKPISGTAQATENGLIIVDVGQSDASVALDTANATAKAAADPSLVTVKVRDITKTTPTYTTIQVAPGQTQTILAGTPLESTITAADSTVSNKGSSAAAAADAVRLDLIKGVQGGIHLALGRTTAAAQIQAAPAPPPPAEKPLPVTGGPDFTKLGILLLVGSGIAIWVRRRFA
jgi:hypothetical protein